MDALSAGQLVGIVAFLAVTTLITVSNIYTLRRLGSYPPPAYFPRVSILVPARDEEANIEACVRSLLAQEYPDFELIVLDDNSEDRTAEILHGLAAADARLRLIKGRPLPAGWMGKHWAGHQLAQAAGGELLLFTDADTRHEPRALREAASALVGEDADLLSVLPREETGSWSERLVVPAMMWGILAFMPLWLAYRWQSDRLATAVGQFMLFRRRAYDVIGGFEAVRQAVLDDYEMARRIKAAGLRWRLASGLAYVRCRMYKNAKEVFSGFGKNFHATLGGNIPLFLFSWTWLVYAFLQPLFVLGGHLAGAPVTPAAVALAAVAVLLALALWAISYRRFGFPQLLVLLYPLTIVLVYGIALYSVALRLSGRSKWKGRTVAQPKNAQG